MVWMMSLFLLALVFKIRISQGLEVAILFGVTFVMFLNWRKNDKQAVDSGYALKKC